MATVADLLKASPPPSAGPQAPVQDDTNPFDQFEGAANPFDQFTPPPARTTADLLKMGARGVLTGVGGLADIVAGPANATVNAVAGTKLSTHPGRDAATAGANALGLPEPVTDQEKFANAVNEGGVQGLATAGLGAAGVAAKAPGALGTVARAVAASPGIDTVASAAAGGGSEVARQNGAGPLGQLAAGLAAAVPTAAGARRVADLVAGLTERLGPKAAKIVTEVPREAVLDEKGALTEEGRDVAAHNGLHPDDLKTAYDEVDAAIRQPEAAAAPEQPMTQTVRRYQGVDYPVEVLDPTPVDHMGEPHVRVRGEDGAEGYVPQRDLVETPRQSGAEPVQAAPIAEPTGPLETPPSAAPEAVAANDAGAAPEEPLAAGAQERVAQAQSEGVGLTRGQATQDFETQAKEQSLAGANGPEAHAVRQFFTQQQEQIGQAVDRFKQAFGNPDATASERGQLVKDALADLRDKGKAGVTALYNQARDIAQAAGGESQNLIHLDTQRLLERMRELFTDEAVPDQVRKSLKQQAAKYGLIGDSPKTVEGETTVSLRDNTGEPAGKVTFTGPPQRLTLLNAEDLRQKVNQLYEADTSKTSQSLKPIIDDAVQGAVERAAREGTGDVGRAFQAARAGHVQQLQTFKAKDVVQKLIDWKRGTQTPVVLPENAIKTIFAGGKEATTELRKVKAILLSNPTPKSKAAWQAIQAHAVADIFDKAFVLNANPGGGVLGQISGAKLNTAIAKFGADKLKVLLPETEFNQLMKLRRIIGDATIPIQRTTNPSGSGWAVIRFLAGQGMKLAGVARFVPGVGPIVDTAAGLMRVGREASEAKKTAAGVTDFTAEAAAKADAPKAEPADYARKFISVAGSDEIIAPLIASAANEQHR